MGQSGKGDPGSLNDYFAEICTATKYRNFRAREHKKKYSFNLNQIYEDLKKIRKTACEPDEKPFCVWSENAHSLEPVMKIFNRSLETNTVPSLMKGSRIFPNTKCKNPSGASDYRPVFITPVSETMMVNCYASEQLLSAQKPTWF